MIRTHEVRGQCVSHAHKVRGQCVDAHTVQQTAEALQDTRGQNDAREREQPEHVAQVVRVIEISYIFSYCSKRKPMHAYS